MCQALGECQLSVSASQNVCLPGHSEASVSGTFGREGARGWGLLIRPPLWEDARVRRGLWYASGVSPAMRRGAACKGDGVGSPFFFQRS